MHSPDSRIYKLSKEGKTELIRDLMTVSGSQIAQISISKSLKPAIKKNHILTVRYLLSIGADINYIAPKDKKQRTPLFIAISSDIWQMVRELLKHPNCDTSARDSSGNTVLLYAIQKTVDIEIIKELQSLPVCQWLQTTPNNLGQIPLGVASDINVIKNLIDNGAPVNQTDRYGVSPILTAIRKRYKKAIKLLLEAGCNVNYKTIYGETPLLRAINTNQFQVVQILLDAGALIDFAQRPSEIHKHPWSFQQTLDFRQDEQINKDKLEIEKLLDQKARQVKKERTYILLLGRKDPNSVLWGLPIDMIMSIRQLI